MGSLTRAQQIFTFCERFISPSLAPGEDVRQSTVLMTKAGPVPVFYNPYRQVAACAVPHNLHLHKDRVSMNKILAGQPQLQIVPTYDKIKDKTFPIVSGVKGMTFALVDLTDAPEVLGALKASEAPEYEVDAEWSPSFTGAFYYKRQDSMIQENEPTIHPIQARMITQGIEDPGTGSASSALACYLATDEMRSIRPEVKKNDIDSELSRKTEQVKLDERPDKEKLERHVYAIQQGVEMGRHCTIAVEVDLKIHGDGSKSVANVTLSGRVNFFARGELQPF
jgi:predicted PhzF superfamily epimerase YddE/YHI9